METKIKVYEFNGIFHRVFPKNAHTTRLMYDVTSACVRFKNEKDIRLTL
jgi:hypothetical protein